MSKLLQEINNMIHRTCIDETWFDTAINVYKKPNPERYEIAASAGSVETLEGPVQYPAGYYIMTGPKGERYPISPSTFKDLKDDCGDGICIPKKIIKLAKLADHDGAVTTSWGEMLNYTTGNDYIVRHGPGDYGVVKVDIFNITYEIDN